MIQGHAQKSCVHPICKVSLRVTLLLCLLCLERFDQGSQEPDFIRTCERMWIHLESEVLYATSILQ